MNKEEIIKSLNERKDFTWIIKDEGEKKFSISKNILYLNGIGTYQGEPNNTIKLIRDYVIEKIGVENLVEKMDFYWEQINSFKRLIQITFEMI